MRIRNVFVLFVLTLFSLSASAMRQYSSNKIYFSASGDVIGQDAYYCNNVHWRGGNVTSPYVLIVEGGCGGCIVTPSDPCEPNYQVKFKLIGGAPFTAQEACQLVGGNVCTNIEPDILIGYGFVVTPV
jgi:hypothetical protein